MKYYVIRLNKGKVIGIDYFDDEESRDRVVKYWKNNMCLGRSCYEQYDEIQTLNEVT